MTAIFNEPLQLEPRLDAKQWGGRRLADWGKQLPAGAVGEALESGNEARVLNGPHAGRTLGELARTYPAELLGVRGRALAGDALDFPLLVKFIDAQEWLSVQVHPDDEQAPAGRRGKCEAWLILDAEPGAQLITGLRGPLELQRLDAQLQRREARAGDVFLVPPGTLHAIGAGVLLYEIQQPSDVTYRVYDWGRERELHVEDGARVARADGLAQLIEPHDWRADAQLLVACPYFALERRTFNGGMLEALPSSCRVLTLQEGELAIGGLLLTRGDSVVLPAALAGQLVTGQAVALIAWAPDLEREIVAPLRAAGVAPERIDALTGAGVVE